MNGRTNGQAKEEWMTGCVRKSGIYYSQLLELDSQVESKQLLKGTGIVIFEQEDISF